MAERLTFSQRLTRHHRPIGYAAALVVALATTLAVRHTRAALVVAAAPASANAQTQQQRGALARVALGLERQRSLAAALTALGRDADWIEAARTDLRGTLLGSVTRPAQRAGGCTAVQVDEGPRERLVMTFAVPCAGEAAATRQTPWATALLGLVGALGALGAVLLAARSAEAASREGAARLGRLDAGLARVAAGESEVQLDVDGDDEITNLLKHFNQMVDELRLVRGRVDALQRIAAWQEFARRLAHEIKNPLTPIQLAAQELARKYKGDDAQFARTLNTATEVIEEEVATLRRLVSAFSEFARLPEVKLAQGDLGEFVRDMASSRAFLEEAGGGHDDVAVRFDAGEGAVPVRVDRILLRRAVENLVRNAIQAIAQRGRAGHVWVRVEPGVDPGAVSLVVEDDGPGIGAADQARVFDPYFTTKSDGTGLGLAIVRKVALDHDGDVGVEDRPGGGARFVLTLPRTDAGRKAQRSFVTFSPRSG
ncbi:MAG: HAMP domain-containing protein [Myxococcales bacterium]|nr:HAMP domain-containing protein [Myxococcales bacterium]